MLLLTEVLTTDKIFVQSVLCFPPWICFHFADQSNVLETILFFTEAQEAAFSLLLVFCHWRACWVFWTVRLFVFHPKVPYRLIDPRNNLGFSLLHTLKCVIIVSGVISHNYYKVIIITLVPRSSNYTPDPLYQVRYFSVKEKFQSLSSQPREKGREIRKLQPIPWPVQEATASCAKDSISHRPIRPFQIFQNTSQV